jgi:hypothetical protein
MRADYNSLAKAFVATPWVERKSAVKRCVWTWSLVTFSSRRDIGTVTGQHKERQGTHIMANRATRNQVTRNQVTSNQVTPKQVTPNQVTPNQVTSNQAKSSFKLKILCGEGDAEMLASKAASIQKAGHQVETAVDRKGVEEALRRGSFDLVILGPTLTKNDRHHLPYVIKKAHTQTRVLVMHSDGERHPQVDASVETGRTIEDLLATIASMLAKETSVSGG